MRIWAVYGSVCLLFKNDHGAIAESILVGRLFSFRSIFTSSFLFILVTILTGSGFVDKTMSYDFKGGEIRAKGGEIRAKGGEIRAKGGEI